MRAGAAASMAGQCVRNVSSSSSAHRYRRTVHWTRSSGVIELSMDGRKVRMSDVPSKDCNGVLRMQVMIANSGGSVVARYGPDRASARACIPVHDSHLPEANSDHDKQTHKPKQTTDTDVHTRSEISWKFLGLQRKIPRFFAPMGNREVSFTAGPKICCRR